MNGSLFLDERKRMEMGRTQFQTPNSVSLFVLTEFRGDSSVSSSQPVIGVQKRTHRISHRTRHSTQ